MLTASCSPFVLLLLLAGPATFAGAAYCGPDLADEPWPSADLLDSDYSIEPWTGDNAAAGASASASASASGSSAAASADASAAASAGEQLLNRPISQLVSDVAPSGDAGAIFELATGLIGDYLPAFNQFGSFLRASANTLAATSWLSGAEHQRVLDEIANAGDAIASVSAQTSLDDVLRSAHVTDETDAALALGLAQNVLLGLEPYVPEITFQDSTGGDASSSSSALAQAQLQLQQDD